MNYYPLLALLAFAYAGLVFWMVFKKPAKLWGINKIQTMIKILGEKGTDILFYIVGLIAIGLGIWCITLA
jgi:hypothetical protein